MEAQQETTERLPGGKHGNEATQMWEENHQKIVDCVEQLIKNNIKPGVTQIEKETGISRPTIYKHINEFEKDDTFTTDEKLLRLMQYTVLLKICNQALNGDMKAAKLFTEITGQRKAGRNINNHFINHRSHTIQLNGLVISEEILQKLSYEKRTLIEEIIKSVTGNK